MIYPIIHTTAAQVLRVKQGKPFTGRINDSDYRTLMTVLNADTAESSDGVISYKQQIIRFVSPDNGCGATYHDAVIRLQYIRTFTKKQGWYWRRKASVL